MLHLHLAAHPYEKKGPPSGTWLFDYIAKYVLLNVYCKAMEGGGSGGGAGVRVVVTVAKKKMH